MLGLMESHHLDYSRTLRLLSQFVSTTDTNFDKFLDRFCPEEQVPKYMHDSYRGEWKDWFTKYQARLEESEKNAGATLAHRRSRISAVNPRFILRQWVLEEAISRLRKDNDVAFLQHVLDMATSPFETYGEETIGESDTACLTKEGQDQARLCDIGPMDMQGFQCSCSS
jgi:uncharacterized protein YdiU (UPF0061 family)